jgi:alpha-beta hydrolase superfamily lysophospholipase
VPRLPLPARVEARALTADPALQAWIDRDHLRGTATTASWFNATAGAQDELLSGAARFTGPLLLLAGGDDRIADLAASRRFFAAAGSVDKRLVVYEGLRHELFNELDRQRPLGDAVDWLVSHTG